MPNLAMHQLRVAGVAMQICESLDTNIDTNSVVKACLLHDMGNIIKFNLLYSIICENHFTHSIFLIYFFIY